MNDSEAKAIWMALGDMEKSITFLAARLAEQNKKIEALYSAQGNHPPMGFGGL